jgi:serine/threonine-protein kinase haspin
LPEHLQTVLGLAVAEVCHQFEHRDLHWGNILLKRVSKPNDCISFALKDETFKVRSSGVRVCLIDFTLSRVRTPDGSAAYCQLDELEDDWLFNGERKHPQVRVTTIEDLPYPENCTSCASRSYFF